MIVRLSRPGSPSERPDDAVRGACMAIAIDVPEAPPDVPARRAGAVRLLGLMGALALLGLVIVLSVAIGAKTIPLGTSWQLLWHDDGSAQAAIIHDLRIPRTLIGLLVGAALGLSG